MMTEIQMWHNLVNQFVSQTAFIDEDRVYIKEAGILEVPMYDAVVVMQMMNYNPHLMNDVYRQWERGEDSIERAFCVALQDQLDTEQALMSDAMCQAMEVAVADMFGNDALLQLVQSLFGPNITVVSFADIEQEVKVEVKTADEGTGFAKPTLQSALFSALQK